MENVIIRKYEAADLNAVAAIWNEVIEDGSAFAEEGPLSETEAAALFERQTYASVAESDDGLIVGAYILHPNFPGRLSHICNASYAVLKSRRGQHIGEKLVLDCIDQAKRAGFRILQLNAVLESNLPARRLYERLGFRQVGTIPGGFRLKAGGYESICPYYLEL